VAIVSQSEPGPSGQLNAGPSREDETSLSTRDDRRSVEQCHKDGWLLLPWPRRQIFRFAESETPLSPGILMAVTLCIVDIKRECSRRYASGAKARPEEEGSKWFMYIHDSQ